MLLRGVNVGGHRRFRPTRLVHDLRRFGMVNIGAAGTFVVRHPGSRRELRATLIEHLPAGTVVVFCDGRDVRRLVSSQPFGPAPAGPDVVRFVSFLAQRARARPALPVTLPAGDDWLVRVMASRGRLVLGEYRRHMRTIGSLGQLDTLFGVPATTRSWTTVCSIVRVLDGEH